MEFQNSLEVNGKFPDVSKGINEIQNWTVPVSNESQRFYKQLFTVFDFKSIQEWQTTSIDNSYLDHPMTLVNDLKILCNQSMTFCKFTCANFEDRLVTIPMYDLNNCAIQAIKMSLFCFNSFGNSIKILSSTTQNMNDLKIIPKAFVIQSTLDIYVEYNKNHMNNRPVHNKALTVAHAKHLSNKNARSNSRRNFTFLSNVYNQIKTISFNKVSRTQIKSGSSSQNLLQHMQKPNTDDSVIRRNLIVKIDVNNNWMLLERVLRYSMVREIPIVVVFNLNLDEQRADYLENFLIDKGLTFDTHYANINNIRDSNVLIFYMAQPDLNLHLTRSQRYQPRLNELNNFMMVDIDFNQSRFQIISVYASNMSEENEKRLYLRLNRIVNNTPTILIVQSPNGRFHTTCASGDLVLELANEDLLDQLGNTDGTLIYISKEFPEDIRNIRVFTGEMRYRRSRYQSAHLEAYIVVISVPLNQ